MFLWPSDSSTRGNQPHPEDQGSSDQAPQPNSFSHGDTGQSKPAGGPAGLLHWAVSDHRCWSLPALSQHSGFCCTLLQEGQAPARCPQALQPPAERSQRPGSHSGRGDYVPANEATLRPGSGLQGGRRLPAPTRHGAENCLPTWLHSGHEALTGRHSTHDSKHHYHDPEHHGRTHLAPLFQHLSQQRAE